VPPRVEEVGLSEITKAANSVHSRVGGVGLVDVAVVNERTFGRPVVFEEGLDERTGGIVGHTESSV